jgi:hypothetical protein
MNDRAVQSTRRSFLARGGSVGLIATLSAGLADLVTTTSAHAAAESCCTRTCVRDEYTCNGGHACPSGYCCFNCTGSCYPAHVCLPISCQFTVYDYRYCG